MDKYAVQRLEGSGRSCKVYSAKNTLTNEIVVVKNIIYRERQTRGVPYFVIREASILKELDHENIVRLLDVVASEKEMNLIFEYMDLDLKKYLIYEVPLRIVEPRVIKSFLHQILSAVAYIHSHKIIHRDLKPQNILVDIDTKVLKVADFGLSRDIGVPRNAYTAEVGTLRYKAPEILLGVPQYSYAMDIWAVGCIFAEMSLGTEIFDSVNFELDQIIKIFSILGTPNEETWPGCTKLDPKPEALGIFPPQDLAKEVPDLDEKGIDLLSKMLCLDPSKRISAHEALEHPYFTEA